MSGLDKKFGSFLWFIDSGSEEAKRRDAVVVGNGTGCVVWLACRLFGGGVGDICLLRFYSTYFGICLRH